MSESGDSYEEPPPKRPRTGTGAGAGATAEPYARVCYVKRDIDEHWRHINITEQNMASLTAAVIAEFELDAEGPYVLYVTDEKGGNLRHISELVSVEPPYILVKEYPATVEGSIAFLKDRGVLADEPMEAEIAFSKLRNPESVDKKKIGHYQRAQARALRLVQPAGTRAFEAPPSDVHTFSAAEFPGYTNIPYITDPTIHAQRHQLSGLCYMHAGAVVQYYSIWHAVRQSDPAPKSSHGMLDLAYEIRSRFSAEALRRHVFDDDGGNSMEFLESILLPGSWLRPLAFDGDIQAALDKYGPALVSRFKVHTDFKDTEVHHHYGEPTGSFAGYHAMVLHGVREDAKHGRCFLLQNWWKRKQFVEVNETYLHKVRAAIHFVDTPQTSVPSAHLTISGHYFENELLDKPESLYLENTPVTTGSTASPLCTYM